MGRGNKIKNIMAFENLIIRARSVAKSYGSETVLSDFNLDVWNGSIVGILGISGSGKTTALRLLAGFDKPDSGIIEMRDKVISSKETFMPPEERNIGMVFQARKLQCTMQIMCLNISVITKNYLR